MELYEEILARRLVSEKVKITFPNLKINTAEIDQMECYRVLKK